jgi:hypothetical protein
VDHRIALADVEIELVEGRDPASNEVFQDLDLDIRLIQVVTQQLAVALELRADGGEEELDIGQQAFLRMKAVE